MLQTPGTTLFVPPWDWTWGIHLQGHTAVLGLAAGTPPASLPPPIRSHPGRDVLVFFESVEFWTFFRVFPAQPSLPPPGGCTSQLSSLRPSGGGGGVLKLSTDPMFHRIFVCPPLLWPENLVLRGGPAGGFLAQPWDDGRCTGADHGAGSEERQELCPGREGWPGHF